MPGAKDPQEAEIVLRLERSAGDAVDRVAGQGLGFEGALAGECHGLCGGLVSDPVADPIGVAGPLGWWIRVSVCGEDDHGMVGSPLLS